MIKPQILKRMYYRKAFRVICAMSTLGEAASFFNLRRKSSWKK